MTIADPAAAPQAAPDLAAPDLAAIEEAAARISAFARETPVVVSDELDRRTGGRILIKAEPLQRTGSFKIRGAASRISQLTADERRRGVLAYSSGNHAQAVACAAAQIGAGAVIVMPRDAPRLKIERTRRYGAEVVLYDRYTENREAIGARIATERGMVIVPPYDHPAVIAGGGTLGREFAKQVEARGERLDALIVCCGGGGLIAGTAVAVTALSPATRIYAAEPAGFDDTTRSLASGERESVDPAARSICDALLSPTPGVLTFAINRALLAGGLVVSDAEVAAAMRFAFAELKLVVEPGGAAALAAVLTGKLDLRGQTVGVVLTGGNVDPELFSAVLAGSVPPAG